MIFDFAFMRFLRLLRLGRDRLILYRASIYIPIRIEVLGADAARKSQGKLFAALECIAVYGSDRRGNIQTFKRRAFRKSVASYLCYRITYIYLFKACAFFKSKITDLGKSIGK